MENNFNQDNNNQQNFNGNYNPQSQQNFNGNYNPQNGNPNNATDKNGKAVASLVLGIVGLVCIFFGYGALIGIICAIVGIVLGTSAKKEQPSSMANAGVVLGIVALALCIVSFLACVACAGALASAGALNY